VAIVVTVAIVMTVAILVTVEIVLTAGIVAGAVVCLILMMFAEVDVVTVNFHEVLFLLLGLAVWATKFGAACENQRVHLRRASPFAFSSHSPIVSQEWNAVRPTAVQRAGESDAQDLMVRPGHPAGLSPNSQP